MSTCAHCGRPTGDYAGGVASIGTAPVCHPNDPDRPDCYRMITVYGHDLYGCAECRPTRRAE